MKTSVSLWRIDLNCELNPQRLAVDVDRFYRSGEKRNSYFLGE